MKRRVSDLPASENDGDRIKIMSIIGARPQFIKLAPIASILNLGHDHKVIHTGQHYSFNMNDVFFSDLDIPSPDYNLEIGSSTHGVQTAKMIEGIERILLKEKPDLVIVYGDTNSTLAGAIATSKMNIILSHVEAGLRSYDMTMPEEVNRVVSDHVSDILFCPTSVSISNLKNENITNGVHLTGDVMVDVLKRYEDVAEEHSKIHEQLDIKRNDYILATIHRQSNTDSYANMSNLAGSLKKIDNLIFPCHPRTKKMLIEYGLYDDLASKVNVIEPVGYMDMLMLEKYANKILTDSGGIQKEAYVFKVPCITLRENTEWIETVEDGWNVLVGCEMEKIDYMVNNFNPSRKQGEVFGNGQASKNICSIIDTLTSKYPF